MATINLTTGADEYHVYIKMKGGLLGVTPTLMGANLIDAGTSGTGVDVLYIEHGYQSADYTLTEDATGTITISTSSAGSTTFKNFEVLKFNDGTVINLGTAGNDTITGTAKNDTILYGLAGNDYIDGGAGGDKMYGGLGDDTFVVDSASDVVTEAAGEGTDLVKTSLASYTLGANVDNLTYDNGATADVAFTGTGNILANVITGGSAADTLSGGDGDDTITGGAGNDTIDGGLGTGDTVVLTGLQANYTFSATQIKDNVGTDGTDTISNIEYVQFSDGTKVTLASLLVAPITGTTGDDTIVGTTGADTMIGLAGNDTYTVDNAGDVVTEALNAGTDTILTSLTTYSLASLANVENLTYTGSAAFTGTGNAAVNVITGGTGTNALYGGDGNDTITGNALADTIDGGIGADAMTGGAGNDTYYVDNAGDHITELALGGTDTVLTSLATYTLEANVDNVTYTGASAFTGTGNGDANVIIGGTGADTIDGGAGADTMTGGAGNDTYTVDNAGDHIVELALGGTDTVLTSLTTYTLEANVDNVTYTGAAAFTGTGNGDANVIIGGIGADTIDGGQGADAMTGGAGNDTYYVDNAGDHITELALGGTDTVLTSLATYTLEANVDNVTYTGASAFTGTGNGDANVIIGGTGADTIDGGAGADTMTGGAGNDTYTVDNAGDHIVELALGGTDTVLTSLTTYTLEANVDNVTYTGAAAFTGTGNGDANVIIGGIGADTIDGGQGADAMTGGAGDDTYYVDNAGDTVTEVAGGGTDTVISSVDIVLSAEVEKLVLTGAAVNATANASDNIITGNALNNTIDGGAGNDTLVLSGAVTDYNFQTLNGTATTITDARVGGDGTDTVSNIEFFQVGGSTYTLAQMLSHLIPGTAGNDTLVGTAANDTIDGGLGADSMSGGLGDDCYIVDNVGDTVNEVAGEGIADEVDASVSYALAANVEQLVLMGTAAAGLGNDLANKITGNDSANTIDGGTNADTMIGGKGDDTYTVDNAGDVVTENLNEGNDTILSSVNITALAANVENLTLLTGALIGKGNGLVNTITGNAGANTLDGLGGADKMAGGAGNDTYYVDNIGDVVTEALSAGVDKVISTVTYTLAANVDDLLLAGALAINGKGNALVNTITGNAAANTIDGMAGADKMIGGLGNDTYFVDNALDTVTELAGQGTADHVKASVSYTLAAAANIEFLETANAALTTAVNLTGNALANTITGNAGANIITGGAGHDVMTGGAGKDTFVFSAITDTTKVATTRDFITDFTHLTDKIDLHLIDANTKVAADQAFSFLAANGAAFTGVAGQLHYLTSGANTVVEGDTNGDKVADFQIQLNGIKVLTAVDFVL